MLKSILLSKHVITIILLTLLAAYASYNLQTVPTTLLLALIVTVALDIAFQKGIMKRLAFPYSAIISGLIIGSIAPLNAPYYIIVTASSIAVASKFLLRFNGSHIFNPAAFGLLVALALFATGDQWWVTQTFNVHGYALSFLPLLIIADYKAMKWKIAFSGLAVIAILYILAGALTLSSISWLNVVDFAFALPYYLLFIMVPEPKTSPYKWKQQVVFGAGVAVAVFLLTFYSVSYALLMAVLMGNIAYFFYVNLGSLLAQKTLQNRGI